MQACASDCLLINARINWVDRQLQLIQVANRKQSRIGDFYEGAKKLRYGEVRELLRSLI